MPKPFKSPPPPLKTPAELKAYADEHLVYEIQMFFGAVLVLRGGKAGPSGFFKNASVEAFGNHLRNLLTFLYPDEYPVRPDDIVAYHYLAGVDAYDRWCSSRPGLSDLLRDAKNRTDKEMAHLTIQRIHGTPPEKVWPVLRISQEVLVALWAFVQNADAHRLGSAVPDALPPEA